MARDQRDPLRGAAGKLKAAVRHWLNGGAIPDETDEALASFGLIKDESVAHDGDEPFRVYAVNWETLQIFWATWKQWKKTTVGNSVVRDGIDWAQVESALKLSRIKRSRWTLIFEGLLAMQDEAIETLNGQNG